MPSIASRFSHAAWFFLLTSTILAVAGQGTAKAEDKVFDELRFGASASIQGGHSHEDGIFPEISVFFDPFGSETAVNWKERLLRPRVQLGTSIGTAGEATQFFTGFSWTIDLGEKLFVEAGIGGTIHTGELDDDDDGPALGSRVLFREYAAAGLKLDDHWRVMAQIAHSSDANLRDGPNDGMTRAGILVGYKF